MNKRVSLWNAILFNHSVTSGGVTVCLPNHSPFDQGIVTLTETMQSSTRTSLGPILHLSIAISLLHISCELSVDRDQVPSSLNDNNKCQIEISTRGTCRIDNNVLKPQILLKYRRKKTSKLANLQFNDDNQLCKCPQ